MVSVEDQVDVVDLPPNPESRECGGDDIPIQGSNEGLLHSVRARYCQRLGFIRTLGHYRVGEVTCNREVNYRRSPPTNA